MKTNSMAIHALAPKYSISLPCTAMYRMTLTVSVQQYFAIETFRQN
ncbi:hypothetical protein VCHE25_0793 [Vibrio cholerae HE-25]|nr:hypothetical protein VCHE25_0793 [Vibrio cholerae HE-25]